MRPRGRWLAIGDPVFRSRRVTRWLFGADPCPEGGRLDHDAFDFATLALRRGLGRWLRPGRAVVEVGTGASAVLAGWLARRGHPVVAWEAHPPSAERARGVLRAALGDRAPAVVGGRFAEGSDVSPGALVVANPPYVPTATAVALGLDPARPHAWDGGPDGLEGYRELGRALAGRAEVELVVGGSRHFHRPGDVARALGRRPLDRISLGPGYALRLG